ncbi:AAA domain-containing protein [Providencia stuartii]|uniref:AAA domain-containing protein n=1 Tax=Providencia stuartii TaxID=588 RepID=UPI001FF69BFA|nr:AAA domain-containing protein [Providencia stuartii]MCK1142982.1 AAA domain-containing protein [Providencia stuartii]
MTMIRFCPHCHTKRPLTEIFCEGDINNQTCGWDLTLEPIHDEDWEAPNQDKVISIDTAKDNQGIDLAHDTPPIKNSVCTNGHPMEEGELICFQCGADIAEEQQSDINQPVILAERMIGNWCLQQRINDVDSERERYAVTNKITGQVGVLTLYQKGEEPDLAIYQVLNVIPVEHIPVFYETGRWENRAWHVTETLTGGSLSQFIQRGEFWRPDEIPRLVEEMGQALATFAEHGLRHRALRPSNLLIRSREPLDIVVIEYGSASLSEFDLDIVSPLDISRYTAPETLAGGVCAASDWWSLGMILLEQLTRGQCFEHIHDNAFLIQIMTNGVELPDDLDPNTQLLLRGLLNRDRFLRWQWPQVSAWLQGRPVQALETTPAHRDFVSHSLQFAGHQFKHPNELAMMAAEATHWDDAVAMLTRGEITSWLAKFADMGNVLSQLQRLVGHSELEDNLKLTLALRILNPNIPFVYQGEIITPAWLLTHPALGYQFISEPLTDEIQRIDEQHWLAQLYYRQCRIRQRAEQQKIPLNEESLKLYLLITSVSQLAARWDIFHQQFPDTHNDSLKVLIGKQKLQEDDYILLLSADIGQFISLETITNEAARLAQQQDISDFDETIAKQQLTLPRAELFQQLVDRLAGFKRIGILVIDQWVDTFLLTRRLPLPQILVMLAIPKEQWQVPESQKYILEVLNFFSKRLVSVTQRGNLVRMRLTANAGRVDLVECASSTSGADKLLEHLINRKSRPITVDGDLLLQRKGVNNRLWTLQSDTQLYQRDTGINGMYLGFPFLLLNTQPNQIKPRIAPLFLWPVSIQSTELQRGPIQLAFDNERAAVRLNPALANFVGIPAMSEWQKVLDKILSLAALSVEEVMTTLANTLPARELALTPLPSITEEVPENSAQIVCSAVLFHTSFIGQAISSDLRLIASQSIQQTALATMLNLDHSEPQQSSPIKTDEQYFLSLPDPSQESVVQAARQGTGLLIEGPPGTGKSQTIVNLIADAIGHQQTVLVICQKPAALDVVYKRLVANGLTDRVLLINQNQKPREIIQAVREQIEQLWGRLAIALHDDDWRHQRRQIQATLKQHECLLDDYYQAMFSEDEQLKLSYKQVLSELLLTEQTDYFSLDKDQIQPYLASLDRHTVIQFVHDLKSHAPRWLSLNYQNNPLNCLTTFLSHDSQYHCFNHYFPQWVDDEQQRENVNAVSKSQINIHELTNHRAAFSQCQKQFSALTTEQWHHFSQWLTLFLTENGKQTVGTMIIQQLTQLNDRLCMIDTTACDPLYFPLFTQLDHDNLSELSRAISEKRQGSLLKFFNPFYYVRKSKLNQFIASSGIGKDEGKLQSLLKTIDVEQQWRLLYQELQPIYGQLAIAPTEYGQQWRHKLSGLIELLKHVEVNATILAEYPQPEHFLDSIRTQQHDGFMQQCREVESAIVKAEARQRSIETLNQLAPTLKTEHFQQFKETIEADGSLRQIIEQLQRALPDLIQFQLFRTETAHFTNAHWQCLALLQPQISEEEMPHWVDTLANTLKHYFFVFAKNKIETRSPILSLNHSQLTEHITKLSELQKQLQQYNKQALTLNINSLLLATRREWEAITRLAGPRARRLREFVSEGCELGLMQLRPVWLMTPDVASQILPLKAAMFDTVIYDEASQMPIEFALPTLFRGRQAIVSGDEKQMPPSKFFSGKVVEEDGDEEDEEQQEQVDEQWNYRQISDCPDLLHLARTVLPIHSLDIHYRSVYRELINFSNYAFYENRLNIPAQHSKRIINDIKPLMLLPINGTYVNQSNEDEAKAVIDHLTELWKRPFNERPSIGVVTFNQKQAQLINQHIRAKIQLDEQFHQAYIEENQRQTNDEDMSFFVKNVENVQGDERDVILFSTTFGRNVQGTFRRNFGVLGQTGGERRLNVAITRARQQVVIMSSMPIDEISDLLTTYRKPEIPRDYLQGYLAYAKNLNDPLMQQENHKLLSRMCHTAAAQEETTIQSDAFVESVVSFIRSHGWKIAPPEHVGVFYFDCLIENEATGKFLLGVECDMPHHSLLQRARARELWRAGVLERIVPHRHRVSLTEWYYAKEEAQQRLLDAIHRASLN